MCSAPTSAPGDSGSLRQLTEEFWPVPRRVSARASVKRVSVTNPRAASASAGIKEAIAEGRISEGHARALLGLNSTQAQAAALHTVLNKGLNVRHTEELVRKLSGHVEKAPKAEPTPVSAEEKDLQERLRSRLGTKVDLTHSKKGGSITIYYYSDEELDSILEMIL